MQEGEGYRKKCKRHNQPGHVHELTFSCYRRRPFLSCERTCLWLVDAINHARQKHDFSLWAYVFMPEHVHLLLLPTQPDYSISLILRSIKQPVAQRAIAWLKKHNPAGLKSLETGQKHAPLRFWQDGGGYDRNIYQDESLVNSVRYIHYNPVRRGLVDASVDWKFSSASAWHNENGPLELDLHTYPLF